MSGTKEGYINYRVQKSQEIFDDALLLLNNQRWNSCVNRLYYSSFHLVSALLYKNELKHETHNGVKTQFNIHFVKKQLVSIEYGKLYSNLFDWRQESDYADSIDFDDETVAPLIQQVKEFNRIVLALIQG